MSFKIAYVVVVLSWIFGFEIVNMSEWREEGKKGREKEGTMGRWCGDKEKWDSSWKAYALRPTLSCNLCNRYDK